jgi:3-oxoacyl-[acyl-carrier-protein] synthase II
MGCISPLGLDVDTSWQAIINGESSIRQLEDGLTEPYAYNVNIGAKIESFTDLDMMERFGLSEKDLRRIHRSAQFSNWAAAEALRQAGLLWPGEDALNDSLISPNQIGTCIGTGIGGAEVIIDANGRLREHKRVLPNSILQVLPERVATTASMRFGLKGPLKMVGAACATGNASIADAANSIKLHDATVMVAGASEAQLTAVCIGLFDGTSALSREQDPLLGSRPFHKNASGFVIGEGAGIFVLESLAHARKRGAFILAEIVGTGERSDGAHDTAPSGDGAKRAISQMMKQSGIAAWDNTYINAHATGTAGDAIEMQAIDATFYKDEVVGISSTKGATGHMLAATGAFEAVMSVMALRTNIVPPTLKLDDPIPETEGWNMSPHVATEVESITYAVNNSFGFGGINSVIGFSEVPN